MTESAHTDLLAIAVHDDDDLAPQRALRVVRGRDVVEGEASFMFTQAEGDRLTDADRFG